MTAVATAPHASGSAMAKSRARASSWTTPGRLRAFLVMTLVGSALLLAIGEATLKTARDALYKIGKDTAPSIIAAQEIQASLADLDANMANYLLVPPEQQDGATQLFEFRRAGATKRLVDAAQNISEGDKEKVPIVTM